MPKQKSKVIKEFRYEGLGFPIILKNVSMVFFDNAYHPQVNVKEVANTVINSLVSQKSRLTGNQIKFIRSYFDMSLREFAKVVNESHMAVKKWEDFKDEATNMDRNIEIMLRLYVYDRIVIKTKNDSKGKLNFYNQFVDLREMFSH